MPGYRARRRGVTESANGPRTNHAAVPDRAHMTDTATSTGRADSAVPTTYNVIAVAFEDVNAYAALTKLKELDAQGQVAVIDAAMGALGGTVTPPECGGRRGRDRRRRGGAAQGSPRGPAGADARSGRADARGGARQGRGAQAQACLPWRRDAADADASPAP